MIVGILTVVTINTYRNTKQDIETTLTLSFNERLSEAPVVDPNTGNTGKPLRNDVRIGAYVMLLVDDSGRVLERSGKDFGLSDESISLAIETALHSNVTTDYMHSEEIMYMKREIPNGIRISIADTSNMYDYLNSSILICVGISFFSLILLFFLSSFAAGLIVAPVKQAWTQQKQFIADASHDLKTPLTVILANNNILMSHKDDTIEDQMTWVQSTAEESANMKKLIESMLFLARADEGKQKFEMSETNLSEIAEKLVLHYDPIAFENNVEMITEIDDGIVIKSNEGQATKLFQTLMDNAMKYTDSGKAVTIRLRKKDRTVKFSTENPGYLSEEDIEHIFDRFYRSDSARTDNGFGLGLAIAKSVADSLSAKLYCECKNESVIFTVEFKKKKR